jgi:hypothetical protein
MNLRLQTKEDHRPASINCTSRDILPRLRMNKQPMVCREVLSLNLVCDTNLVATVD